MSDAKSIEQSQGQFGTEPPIETPFGRLIVNPAVPPGEIWVFVGLWLRLKIVNLSDVWSPKTTP